MKAVQLRRPQGVTFASGSSANDAFALNGSVASTILDAYIDASSIVMQDRIGYTTMARAMSTEQAFAEVFDVTVEGLQMQARANIELMSLYGQTDLGTVESASTVSSKRQVVISKATWAAGIWPQLEGALVDVYADSTLASKVTHHVPSGRERGREPHHHAGRHGLRLGDGNNVIVPYGTGTAGASWAKGISKIIQTSGTLFGIDNSVYGNFKGNSYSSVNGVLTLGKINSAASLAWNRGTARKLTCFVSAWTWTDMNVDAAALRRYAESTKAGLDLGTTSITYYGPNGEIEIVPHRFVKAGEAFLLDLSSWSRVGSMDVTTACPVCRRTSSCSFRVTPVSSSETSRPGPVLLEPVRSDVHQRHRQQFALRSSDGIPWPTDYPGVLSAEVADGPQQHRFRKLHGEQERVAECHRESSFGRPLRRRRCRNHRRCRIADERRCVLEFHLHGRQLDGGRQAHHFGTVR